MTDRLVAWTGTTWDDPARARVYAEADALDEAAGLATCQAVLGESRPWALAHVEERVCSFGRAA